MCVCITNEAIVVEWAVSSTSKDFEKPMGSCTAQCEMLLFCVKPVMRESGNFELPHLKKENRFWQLCDFLVWYLQCGAHTQ